MWIPILVITAGLALYAITTYNSFVILKGRIKASIQEIGNQLKRQADLIPNLQESAKAYLQQEKSIFELLTQARTSISQAATSGNIAQMDEASGLLGKAMQGLKVIVESNPEIKSNEIITQLMNELRDTSDKIMYSRRTLIDLVADYNILIQKFPSSFIAKMFDFKPEQGMNMSEQATATTTTVSAQDAQTPKINLQ